MEHISSRENEKVKMACKIATSPVVRKKTGLFFAEGRRLCLDLADWQKPKMAFISKDFLKNYPQVEYIAEETYLISDPVADKLSGTKNSQGIFCLFPLPVIAMEDLETEKGILLCENIQNPENIGAIVRSAAAFGYGGVVLIGGADAYNPKSIRASMGGIAKIPVVNGAGLEEVRETLYCKGVKLYAANLENAKPLSEIQLSARFALAIGNEGAGLSDTLLAMADEKMYIPMQNGMESLNAAVAASVLLFYCKL